MAAVSARSETQSHHYNLETPPPPQCAVPTRGCDMTCPSQVHDTLVTSLYLPAAHSRHIIFFFLYVVYFVYYEEIFKNVACFKCSLPVATVNYISVHAVEL